MFVCVSNLQCTVHSGVGVCLGAVTTADESSVCVQWGYTSEHIERGLSFQIYHYTLILRLDRLAVPSGDLRGSCLVRGECLSGAFTNSFSSCARCPAILYPKQKPHIWCTGTRRSRYKRAPVNLHICFQPLSPFSFRSVFSLSNDWQWTCRQQLASLCVCSPCPVWDASPTLADSSHMTAEMGGQQIQSFNALDVETYH